MTPAALAGANGFIAFVVAFVYMDILSYLLGYCMLTVAALLFTGAALIATKNYKSGAVLVGIGGVLTIPIGILGIIAASKAWGYSKWRRP